MNRSVTTRRQSVLWLLTLGLLVTTGTASAQEYLLELREVADRKAVFATVQSVDVTQARARIGGTIERLAINEGQSVTAGETLAVVRDEKLPLQLAALDARIASLAAQRDLAAIELTRIRTLRERGTVSQARLDQAQTNFDVVRASTAAAQAERAVVAKQLEEGNIKAPATGRVLQVRVTDGAVVLPGETIASIAAETYVLRLYLPERHARFLQEGDEVLVGKGHLSLTDGAESAPALTSGRIRQVYPELAQGRVVADAEVAGLGAFFVGERVPVHVATGTRKTLVAPEDFLWQRHGVTYARLKDVGAVVVQPGRQLDDGVEVLAGLVAGDIILRP